MRKTTEYKTENRLTVDIEGLMAMLSCGEVTAKKIADYAEARVIIGRRVLYNVDKIKKYPTIAAAKTALITFFFISFFLSGHFRVCPHLFLMV